jgi:hypothetical protein
MQKCKKITAMLLSLLNGIVFAGTMGDVCQPMSLHLPCERNALAMKAHALYLVPSYAGNLMDGNQTFGREG